MGEMSEKMSDKQVTVQPAASGVESNLDKQADAVVQVKGTDSPGVSGDMFTILSGDACKGYLRRSGKSFCSANVRYPVSCFAAAASLILILSAASILSGGMSAADNSEHDWTVTSSSASRRYDALTSAIESQLNNTVTADRSRPSKKEMITIFFDWAGQSIFTPENVKRMCIVENIIYKTSDYGAYCIRDKAATCSSANKWTGPCCQTPQDSVAAIFYPNSSFLVGGVHQVYRECTLLPAATVQSKSSELLSGLNDTTKRFEIGYYLAKNTPTMGYSDITKTGIALGDPGVSDDEYKTFWTRVEDNLFEFFSLTSSTFKTPYTDAAPTTGALSVKWFAQAFNNNEFQRILASDTMFITAAIAFVFFYLCYHVRSMFIGTVTIIQIVFSLLVAFFFYYFIFQITYYTTFHTLVIFLVLGVGADDIFVFMDAWRESLTELHHGEPLADLTEDELTTCLQLAVSRTGAAVFNTSFTTTVAFMACATSPIMPVMTFGIYASIAIVVNYFMVMGLTPSVCMIHHKYMCIMKPCCCCFRPCCPGCFSPPVALPPSEASAAVDQNDVVEVQHQCVIEMASTGSADAHNIVQHADKVVRGVTYVSTAQRFLHTHYAPFINMRTSGVKVVSLCMVVVFLAYGCFCLGVAAQMEPPTESEEWFQEGHMLYKILDIISNRYMSASSNSYVKENIVFGIHGIDRGGYDLYKPCCNRGNAVYSETFDVTTAQSHKELEKVCATIAAFACSATGCVNTLAQPNGVYCWITAMKVWNNGILPTGKDFVKAAKKFITSAEGKPYAQDIGFGGSNSIQWARIRFDTTFQAAQPYKKQVDVFEVAKALVADISAQVGPSLHPVFQDAGKEWVWMYTQKGLVDGLMMGFFICFPVAFLVLLYASGNILLSLYATMTIAFIVASVLGTVSWGLDYNLGVAECIAGVIVIGFSVDYVVHLAHMYADSKETTSGEKTADSLLRMGHTVFAGAITTFGAGITMMGCKMMFFVKMSVLISLTIFFSLFYAFCFFIPLCAAFGPYNGWGDMRVIFAALTGRPMDHSLPSTVVPSPELSAAGTSVSNVKDHVGVPAKKTGGPR